MKHSQSLSLRLTPIRPAVQQLHVQNPLAESRSRGGGEGATVCMQVESDRYLKFHKESNRSFTSHE